jgi:L-threonylcarbamoyladenylate synthase
MPRIVRVDPTAPDPAVIAEAAGVLQRGGLVAFPTETVYGLGARALDPAALARIFAAKGRPTHHPLIAHVADAPRARALAERWPEAAERLAAALWPGPLTLVVDRAPHVPAALSGGAPSVAVRAPAHPVARALLAALGDPVAAPSANTYQGVSPTLAAHVVKQLGEAVDFVLDGGPADAGIESTVVDVRGEAPVVLRPGAADLARLRAITPALTVATAADRTSRDPDLRASPGMAARHYAPRASLELAPTWEGARARAEALAAGGRPVGLVALGPRDPRAVPGGVVLVALPASPPEYARALYRTLHDLDDLAVGAIVVEDVPRAGVAEAGDAEAWLGVADRLARAAGRLA